MSTAGAAFEEREEAVIISGPRKGQIVTIHDGEVRLSPEEEAELTALEAALASLAESANAATEEARGLLEDLRQTR